MAPGPAPKPTNIKILEGNRGKRKLDPSSETNLPVEAPRKPEDLNEEASKIWDEMVEIGVEMGVLTKADGQILEVYCREKSVLLQAERDLEDNGELYKRTSEGEIYGAHPATLIRDKAIKNLKGMLAELGFSPSSRTRVKVTKTEKKKSKYEDM